MVDVISGVQRDERSPAIVYVPPRERTDGALRSDGQFVVLGRTPTCDQRSCSALWLRVANEEVFGAERQRPRAMHIAIVDYPTFFRVTGMHAPAPLDPNAAYKGHRLP